MPSEPARERILGAACALLAERGGAAAVSMDGIASRAGTTKATVYRHFADKDALVRAATERDVAASAAVRGEVGQRERIVEGAMVVLGSYGLRGATMERIAAEVGLGAPALYRHFRGRDDLLRAVIDRVAALLGVVELEALGAGATSTGAGVEAVVSTLVRRGMGLQERHGAVLVSLLAEAWTDRRLADAVYEQLFLRLWSPTAAGLDRAAAVGALRPGHSLLRVQALVGMLAFYGLARRAFGERLPVPGPEEAADELTCILLRGVLAGHERGAARASRQRDARRRDRGRQPARGPTGLTGADNTQTRPRRGDQ